MKKLLIVIFSILIGVEIQTLILLGNQTPHGMVIYLVLNIAALLLVVF